MVASWISFVGFALGITMTNNGILEPVQDRLRAKVVGSSVEPETLPSLLGVNPWLVIVGLALVGALFLWRGVGKASYQGGWSWTKAGLVIGIIGLLAWLASAATGRMYGLSVTEPAYRYMRFFVFGQPDALNWATFMWIGIPFGSYISAKQHGEFKWRAPGPTRILQALLGGIVMGIGAAIAGGCTVGHSLTGASVLAMSSLTATLGIVFGVWSAAFVLFRT